MPPADEKSLRHAGAHCARNGAIGGGTNVSFGGNKPLVLNGTVKYREAAPTAMLPAAFEWPNDVPLAVWNCSGTIWPWFSNQLYFTTPGSGPPDWTNAMKNSAGPLGSISFGSLGGPEKKMAARS